MSCGPKKCVEGYELGPVMGIGTYGEVRYASNSKTGERVALKIVDLSRFPGETAQLMIKETKILKMLDHPNCIKVVEVKENVPFSGSWCDRCACTNYAEHHPGSACSNCDHSELDHSHQETRKVMLIAQELAAGGELFGILMDGPLPENIARLYFHQLISGLSYLHGLGIIHRDLKPENLVLDSQFNLKIVDFGLAAIVEPQGTRDSNSTDNSSDSIDSNDCDSDGRGAVLHSGVGSQPYSAPEVFYTKELYSGVGYRGGPADVWSCAVILFVMLTGKPPFLRPLTKTYGHNINMRRCKYFIQLLKGRGYGRMSTSAKNLLQRIFVLDPERRLTIDDIKNHPWFCEPLPEPEDLDKFMLNKARKIYEANRNEDMISILKTIRQESRNVEAKREAREEALQASASSYDDDSKDGSRIVISNANGCEEECEDSEDSEQEQEAKEKEEERDEDDEVQVKEPDSEDCASPTEDHDNTISTPDNAASDDGSDGDDTDANASIPNASIPMPIVEERAPPIIDDEDDEDDAANPLIGEGTEDRAYCRKMEPSSTTAPIVVTQTARPDYRQSVESGVHVPDNHLPHNPPHNHSSSEDESDFHGQNRRVHSDKYVAYAKYAATTAASSSYNHNFNSNHHNQSHSSCTTTDLVVPSASSSSSPHPSSMMSTPVGSSPARTAMPTPDMRPIQAPFNQNENLANIAPTALNQSISIPPANDQDSTTNNINNDSNNNIDNNTNSGKDGDDEAQFSDPLTPASGSSSSTNLVLEMSNLVLSPDSQADDGQDDGDDEEEAIINSNPGSPDNNHTSPSHRQSSSSSPSLLTSGTSSLQQQEEQQYHQQQPSAFIRASQLLQPEDFRRKSLSDPKGGLLANKMSQDKSVKKNLQFAAGIPFRASSSAPLPPIYVVAGSSLNNTSTNADQSHSSSSVPNIASPSSSLSSSSSSSSSSSPSSLGSSSSPNSSSSFSSSSPPPCDSPSLQTAAIADSSSFSSSSSSSSSSAASSNKSSPSSQKSNFFDCN